MRTWLFLDVSWDKCFFSDVVGQGQHPGSAQDYGYGLVWERTMVLTINYEMNYEVNYGVDYGADYGVDYGVDYEVDYGVDCEQEASFALTEPAVIQDVAWGEKREERRENERFLYTLWAKI